MKGDEYRDNGTWKPVPADDIGSQIMFTKYTEVRRPSEEPFKAISPDSNVGLHLLHKGVITPTLQRQRR